MLQFAPSNIKTIGKVLSTNVLRTFIFLTLLISFTGCENSMEEIKQLNYEVKALPASTSNNITLQFSDSARVKIILFAPVLDRYSTKEIPTDVMPDGLKIEFIDSLGNVEAQVTCNYAIHYPKKNILELTNDVRVFNKDGDRLNSEHVIWNSKTQKISSPDFVKITTGDEIIYGDGFEANQDFTNYKISHLKGTISISEEMEENSEENESL